MSDGQEREPAAQIAVAVVAKPVAVALVEALTIARDLRSPKDFDPIVAAIKSLDGTHKIDFTMALLIIAARRICEHELQQLGTELTKLADTDRIAL